MLRDLTVRSLGPHSPTCRTGYECGICSCYHPANWDGDCREDATRYPDPDVFDELIEMDDVDEWRRNHA